MKKLLHFKLILSLLLVQLSCSKDEEVLGPPVIETIKTYGNIGDEITILGKNFGSDATAIEVKFNGVLAQFSLISGTRIKAIVPEGASSGFISISRSGSVTESL